MNSNKINKIAEFADWFESASKGLSSAVDVGKEWINKLIQHKPEATKPKEQIKSVETVYGKSPFAEDADKDIQVKKAPPGWVAAANTSIGTRARQILNSNELKKGESSKVETIDGVPVMFIHDRHGADADIPKVHWGISAFVPKEFEDYVKSGKTQTEKQLSLSTKKISPLNINELKDEDLINYLMSLQS